MKSQMTRKETGKQHQGRWPQKDKALEIKEETNVVNEGTKPVGKEGTAKVREPREGPTRARTTKHTTEQVMNKRNDRTRMPEPNRGLEAAKPKSPKQCSWLRGIAARADKHNA